MTTLSSLAMPPVGLALYLRHISAKRHGSPKEFAKRCADHGLRWLAIAALWQDVSKEGKSTSKMINSPEVIERYADALFDRSIEPYVWGYPWQGREAEFVEKMLSVNKYGKCLLDPELGMNPSKATSGPGKTAANQSAEKIVSLFAKEATPEDVLGVSTYGSGYRLKWFPLISFTKALFESFNGRSFIGGQTYTDNNQIDLSIADMSKTINKAGALVAGFGNEGVAIVPNFGVYKRVRDKAVPKSAVELRAHLWEFINEDEPVEALIGWAENFMTPELWKVLGEFSGMMHRGACAL